jgi:predicted pyridoxine 5'-phosphate oxidase superfamily flavin-nucleotide-binding protein
LNRHPPHDDAIGGQRACHPPVVSPQLPIHQSIDPIPFADRFGSPLEGRRHSSSAKSAGLHAPIATTSFLATVNAARQPYIQHRGGPAGFLRLLDENTIGFVDSTGNRQFITQGNLADNPKVHLFLIEYAYRRRVKIWDQARVVEGDGDLTAKVMPAGYKARPEQVILLTVSAWNENCAQHIPQRFEAADVAAALAERDKRIAALETELARLRETSGRPT